MLHTDGLGVGFLVVGIVATVVDGILLVVCSIVDILAVVVNRVVAGRNVFRSCVECWSAFVVTGLVLDFAVVVLLLDCVEDSVVVMFSVVGRIVEGRVGTT